jgi:hypothetical protein
MQKVVKENKYCVPTARQFYLELCFYQHFAPPGQLPFQQNQMFSTSILLNKVVKFFYLFSCNPVPSLFTERGFRGELKTKAQASRKCEPAWSECQKLSKSSKGLVLLLRSSNYFEKICLASDRER